ncbi:dihydrolipoyllysine-residue succinyltransferase component of 2-oxoglutarate dehydrogenase complex [Kushneria pakistanensis]|uniref:Dihydrolipoyllysine-residue succinyltransferase component of 2-oxoglutarate dehydrogenase complex n=1 Tax=Kushneria pakistanensis TaxID=1508770 RepID=A0ABQ3FCA5_9GAMM|nr:2-oxoglutarate dehydrogenase complex dihydrolipoyllysine-residue succinyltransferase [Kushneria pakistanensis]GHC17843.1 dihydrolipoyllysine-residue succinyltransferase component of 2-oxoglutarate dehydrogenase complex [Kushneria pakistanensis]
MATDIKAPSFPESVAEGTVATWHKKPGDSVSRDELIVEIETDKVVLEVVAPADGTVEEIAVQEGEVCQSEQVLGRLGEGGKSAAQGSTDKEDSADEQDREEEASSSKSSSDKPAEACESGGEKPKTSGASVDVKAPSFPESVQEGTVASWNKKVGDPVKRDEVLAEIETDKVVLEVVAPSDGALTEILADEGSQVTSEQVLARFGEGNGDAVGASAESRGDDSQAEIGDANAEQDEKVGDKVLAPAARKLVAEHDLDVNRIQGTGKGGRILKEDVQKAVDAGSAKKGGGDKPASSGSASGGAGVSQKAAAPATAAIQGDRPEQRVPMSRLRQTIAKRLVQAQQTAAMLTTYNEVDMSAVMALRSQYKDDFQKAHDVKLGFMGFFVKAATEALKRFPDVNASIDGTDIVYHGYQDIGVAVSTPRGLVVPVLRDTDSMKLADVEKTIGDFGKRGRDGKLGIEDMQGGTFTITNGGIFGSLMSTPILNPPQTAILGMHKIQERPMAVNGKVEIRPMMYLALSYDHRMIDGKDAVQFLVAIKSLLEDPARFLLDV